MKTYFARHKWELDLDDDARRMLWDGHHIAIHFPEDKRGMRQEDSSSINPDDYDRPGRIAMRALVELAKNGGYVCAEYLGHDYVQVGRIEPGSKIELLNGKCGKRCGREGRTAILKSLQLLDVKYVKPLEYAVIFVGRPRRGTLMRWHTCGTLIKDLVENNSSTSDSAGPSPDQQEILCSEFLRFPPP